jgi:hypothetical protein
MNLSVKSFGQLASVAVALFFFSCSEETSPLGFKNPDPKFENRYIEIPVTSSVILLDSVRTSNGDASNDLNRLIVGKHIDPIFGEVTASAFAQIYPSSNLVNLEPTGTATPNVDENDSLVFVSAEIRFAKRHTADLYHTPINGSSPRHIFDHDVIYGWRSTKTCGANDEL